MTNEDTFDRTDAGCEGAGEADVFFYLEIPGGSRRFAAQYTTDEDAGTR